MVTPVSLTDKKGIIGRTKGTLEIKIGKLTFKHPIMAMSIYNNVAVISSATCYIEWLDLLSSNSHMIKAKFNRISSLHLIDSKN